MIFKPAINVFIPVIALYILCTGCIGTKRNDTPVDKLPATALHAFGRSIINEQQHPELISSACQFGFSFEDRAFHLQVSLSAGL